MNKKTTIITSIIVLGLAMIVIPKVYASGKNEKMVKPELDINIKTEINDIKVSDIKTNIVNDVIISDIRMNKNNIAESIINVLVMLNSNIYVEGVLVKIIVVSRKVFIADRTSLNCILDDVSSKVAE